MFENVEHACRLALRPRRFVLYRHRDTTGVSGTGAVATGVVWPDGHAALRWMAGDCDAISSTSLWSSVEDLLLVHGHGCDSEVVYLDGSVSSEGESRAGSRDT